MDNFCLQPYHHEHTQSRLILETKQGRAWLVFGWEELLSSEDQILFNNSVLYTWNMLTK